MKDIYFVKPSEVQNSKEGYAEIFSSIFEYCYGQDYPVSTLNKKTCLKDVASGKQETVFWAVTDKDRKERKFGTASIVDASNEFGIGYAKICKSASESKKDAKYGYMRFLQELESEDGDFSQFNALVTGVRNCLDRPGKGGKKVRSGVGARISFLKYLQFEQWGVAPWYVMPDDSSGSYEVLDLLFKFRNVSENLEFLKQEKIGLDGKKERTILNKFVALNYKKKPKYIEDPDDELVFGWDLIRPDFKPDKNPQFIVPANNEQTLESQLRALSSLDCASDVIFLPLIASTIKTQKILRDSGWVLTGFIPGRKIYDVVEPYRGIWVMLGLNSSIIKPVYLDKEYKDTLSPKWYFKWVKDTIKKLSSK